MNDLRQFKTSVPGQLDDHSHDFHRLRGGLRDNSGAYYVDFVKTLRPNYIRVWADISIGYLALLGTMIAAAYVSGPPLAKVAVCGLASVSIGYWIAYLHLFVHEAAHYNLARKRSVNDTLSNLWVCSIVAQDISQYRRIHFQHHRALGTPGDTESSYFQAVTPRLLAEILVGIGSLRTLRQRRRTLQNEKHQARVSPWLLGFFAIHGSILLSALYFRRIDLAVTWLAGVLLVFPFFGALRNILEHRSEEAQTGTDYLHEDHGAFTRMFGHGPISSTFGGAGFNRHLLHHWEPQVSYTRLADLEAFLMNGPLRSIIDARRSTYYECFTTLLKRGMARV